MLAVLPVTLADGEQTHELVIDADRAKGPLEVDVQAVPHEAIAANNVVPFQVMVRQDKLRVIYMEGSPDPEYRYIHEALEEDPNITCVSMGMDNMHAAHPTLYRLSEGRGGYPMSREELLGYDVIICSDIARGAFTPEQLEWTVELVSKRGGGFAMIGGNRSFGSGGWDQTVWDGMIPVDMSGHGVGDSEFSVNTFKIRIPPSDRPSDLEDRRRPATQSRDPGAAADVRRHEPDRPAQAGRDAARDLGSHPGIGRRDAGETGGQADPALEAAADAPGRRAADSAYPIIFACQTFGRGRTFAMATDTTWAWGTEFEKSWGEGDNRYFRKFWRNVVYWLTENSDRSNPRLRVETDKVFYQPGEPIEIKAHAYDEKLAETAATGSSPACVVRPRARTSPSTRPRRTWSRSPEGLSIGASSRHPRRARSSRTRARRSINSGSTRPHSTATAWRPGRARSSRSSTIPSSSGTRVPILPGSRGSPAPRLDA